MEEEAQDFDVKCRKCGRSIILDPAKPAMKDDFIDEHIAQHALKEPDDPKEYTKFLENNFEFFDPNKLVVKKEVVK